MREEAREYYRELGREYPERIRQLVPAYDEMVDTLCGLLAAGLRGPADREDGIGGEDAPERDGARKAPSTDPPLVLDLGIGEGTLALRVLESLPDARLTGVDASASMLERARRRLADHLERTELLGADLAGLHPPGPLAAAYSSLTLHNLDRPGKTALLDRLRRRLAPGAPFVWADLIRHPDPELQEHFTRRRIQRARERGCPEDFIAWNFEKEDRDDAPLTPDQTLELARSAGFRRASPAWMRGVFAVFVLRA